jgi:hypothetical protein
MSSLVHQFTEDAGGLSTPASFSCLDLRVRKAILELEKEKTGNWIHTIATIAGIIGVGCLSPAAPALAIGGGVAGLGTLIYGHGQFFGTKGHQLHRLTLLAAAMADATAEQWSQLHYATDGDDAVFLKALESGMLLAENGVEKQGAIFRKAAEYIDTANKGAIEGFVPRPATALVEPQKRRDVVPVTIDEVDAICLICVKAIAQSPDTAWSQKIIDQAAELKATNHQACTNKLIFHSKLTDRQFAAEGITKDRLKLIKAWAAEGAKPGAVATPIVVPPVAVVEPEVTPIAVAPMLHHVAPVVSIVEPETDCEFDIEEYEQEPVKPIAVAPMFFQSNQQRTPIAASVWDTTDLDTIAPADIGNVNQFPVILVVAGQGNGKTCSLAYIFEQLAGRKAMYTPKMDDHRNPAIQQVYDLRFGYNPVTNHAAWYGTPESFDNSPMMDLDWYLDHSRNKFGSALDFIHAANQTAVNRTASGTKKGRSMWRVFYDEAAVTYRAGFNRVVVDGVSLGSKGRQECQEFIAANLIPAIFNWRGAGVQLFIGCQSETVESIGLKGCAEARDEAWHLYPGLKAIEVAKKCKQSKLAAFLQRAVDDDYAIAILEKEEKQFKIIRMPKLAELSRFDPIIEDEDVLEEAVEVIPETVQQAIELDDVWGDADAAEEAVIETVAAPDIDAIKNRIARVMAMPGLTDDEKLDLIETLTK